MGAVVVSVAWASTPSNSLHEFKAGEVILSSEINENFSILQQKVDDTCEALELLSGLDPDEITRVIALVNNHANNVEINESRIEDLESKCVAVVSSITLLEGNSSVVASNSARLDTVEDKTQFMSVTGNTTIFSRSNVQVVNGLGATESTNGLGNLIVGYNEELEFLKFYNTPVDRSGSHNLVIGQDNQYKSYGGLVCGVLNKLDFPFGFVFGYKNSVDEEFGCACNDSHEDHHHHNHKDKDND